MTQRVLTAATLANPRLLGCRAAPAALITTPTPATVYSDDYGIIFDAVWQAGNDEYFDPTFGSKDWQAIGDEYRQKLKAVQDDETFWFQVVNPMLFELGVSHLFALPAKLAREIAPLSFATGSLGMDVRLLDGVTVIARVISISPAAKGRRSTHFQPGTQDKRFLSIVYSSMKSATEVRSI